jgi:hypothetical protein
MITDSSQPLALSTWYFLILDDRDIEQYLKLLAEQSDGDKSRQLNPLKPATKAQTYSEKLADGIRMQMMHDIMSCRIDLNNKIIYRLRPNRTREASRNLRNQMAHANITTLVSWSPIMVGTAIALVLTVFNKQRYLYDYPSCDSELEQLNRDSRLHEWSWQHHLTAHPTIAILVDSVENSIIWSESAFALLAFVSYALTMNYDLIVYWQSIHSKCERLLEVARNLHSNQTMTLVVKRMSRPHTRTGATSFLNLQQRTEWANSIYELQMLVRDFMKQLNDSDMCMTYSVSVGLTIWFVLFAFFIYNTIKLRQGHLPAELSLVLVSVFIVMTLVWLFLLALNRRCLKTYPLICALMALDQSSHKRSFTEILDYFVRRKTCYTIFGSHPMTTTTYFTIISYSFSCFFIICSASNNHQ